jgi:hypothetical protein
MKAALKIASTMAAGWMLSCAVVQGAERGFDDVVRAISDQLHTRPLNIPFLGLVNLATSVAHPDGVKHIDLAVFEGLDLDDHAVKDLAEVIRKSAGGRWKPFVQVRSHQETVIVYMEEDRADCRLLVTTVDTGEVTLVEVRLNPKGLQVWLNEPENTAVHHRGGSVESQPN